MNLSTLSPARGSKSVKRLKGRGNASGNGKTAGRGQDGQKSRSGGGVRPGFEGGQMPLYRRLPKRGFKCRNSKEIIPVNISRLNIFEDGTVVDLDVMRATGIISNPKDGVKILGNGELTKKVTVKANYFSQSAKEKIENAGGTIEVI